MRYKILFFLFCLHFQFCESTYKPPKYATMIVFYILNTYLPEQNARIQCAQPNAIGYSYTDINGKTVACLSNKVSKGLIFDAITNTEIATDTLAPGQSFFCSCGTVASIGGTWLRGNKIEDSPPPGVAVSLILYGKADTPLKYQTHYNQPDNLYCIKTCPQNSGNFQYQFLKIR